MKRNDIEKLKVKVSKEESRLAALKLRKSEILKEIAKTEKNIEDLKTDIQVEEMKNLVDIAKTNKITIDDVRTAMVSGDFLSLQEKIERASEETSETIEEEMIQSE